MSPTLYAGIPPLNIGRKHKKAGNKSVDATAILFFKYLKEDPKNRITRVSSTSCNYPDPPGRLVVTGQGCQGRGPRGVQPSTLG